MDGPKSDGGARARSDLEKEVKILREEIMFNRASITKMESNLAKFDPLQRTMSAHTVSRPPDVRTEYTEEASTDAGCLDMMFLQAKKTIPLVRECNFAQFKNRFNKKEGRYAVDVFMSGLLMHQQMQEEYRLRDRLFDSRSPAPSMKIVNGNDKGLVTAVKIANATNQLISKAQEETWPRRIRIQSPALLRILARVNRETWSDRPRTYYRPFNSLIYHHPRVKEALQELEERWGVQLLDDVAPPEDFHVPIPEEGADLETKEKYEALKSMYDRAKKEYDATYLADANNPTDDDDDTDDDEDEERTHIDEENGDYDDDAEYQKVANCPRALACLRAYVKYIDNHIMPEYRKFEELDVNSVARVRFSDLWFLFRTGELVYRQVEGELPDRRDFRTGKHIWKAHKIVSVPERVAVSATDDTEIRDSAVGNDESAFALECHYVDFTGEEFCIVTKTFEIEQFTGEMPVTALPIYPMRFCQDYEARLKHAEDTGRALVDFIKMKHCSYNGWTLTQDPSGDPTTDVNGTQQLQPEHINSEVMVDFGEAFQACPAWRPPRNILRQDLDEGLTLPDDFRIRWWSGPDRARLLGEATELLPVKSAVAARQYNKLIREDPFIVAVNENARRARPTKAAELLGDSYALLTGRVFAYVFQERKFAQLSVAKLRQSPKTGLALDALKIPRSVKWAIQGSIQGHLLKKESERKVEHSLVSLDLIQGKGTGLFILLHGVPGVGKTATAEAIAQANGKPLFSITVGDLGMTPEKLETSLREIFRLASIWDCILPLDEVDTFFSQRSRSDTATTKNAMVSVFLRVLDYYDGILFLTTNRAGVLDEAFKSRIHYKIYYPELSLDQTLDIWRLNIQRVRQIEDELSKVENRPPLQINDSNLLKFANRHFEENSKGRGGTRWNGRQIRNVFQVALSLAYYEYQEQQKAEVVEGAAARAPTLDVAHFETMNEITTSFEQYRNSVRDATDAELQLQAETRNDRYTDNLTRRGQKEYRDFSLREAMEASREEAIDDNPGVSSRSAVRPDTSPEYNSDSLHPGIPIPSTRSRSNSHNSTSSPPILAPRARQGQPPLGNGGGVIQPAAHRIRHSSSRGTLDHGGGEYPPHPPRSPGSFGGSPRSNAFTNNAFPNYQFASNTHRGNFEGERAYMNTPRGSSPGLGLAGGGRGQFSDRPQRDYTDNRSSMAREGMGSRHRDSSTGLEPDFDDDTDIYDQNRRGDHMYPYSGPRDSGKWTGQGLNVETDLSPDGMGGY